MTRSLTNLNKDDAAKSGWKILKELDCEVVGKAVFEAGNESIMKSTKRFKVPGGWIYNISTEYHANNGAMVAVAEAAVFVPDDDQLNDEKPQDPPKQAS